MVKEKLFKRFVATLTAIAIIFLCGCNDVVFTEERFYFYDGFSVNYIDVGEGDATLIRFSDGKTFLIDCGEKDKNNLSYIRTYLSEYCSDKIDYLMLTHPDSDHVGNAAEIIREFGVKVAFLPDLAKPEIFTEYYSAYSLLINGDTEIKISGLYESVFGEDYFFIMLSPNPEEVTDSSYTALNDSEEPTAKERNNVSPIVYLEYKGVRFVFTGDADISQEKVALNNVNFGFIKSFTGERTVNLEGVDFLKAGHHGSADSTGEEFLRALTPQNVIISVGADNYYGHPATVTLDRIYKTVPQCTVFRTSLSGNITVTVDEKGDANIVTSKKG